MRSLRNKIAYREQRLAGLEQLQKETAQMKRELAEAENAFKADHSLYYARAGGNNENEYELEKEKESAQTPPNDRLDDPPPSSGQEQPKPAECRKPRSRSRGTTAGRPRREWKDLEVLRAEGSDRYWAGRVGPLYLAIKGIFLAMHASPRAYFWTRFDALELGQWLERRPAILAEDVRAMLGAEGVNLAGSAQLVFRNLGSSGSVNGGAAQRAWHKPVSRYSQASVGTYKGELTPEPQPEPEAQEEARGAWNAILGKVRTHILKQSFDTWLKPLKGIRIVDGQLLVMAPGPEFMHLGKKYGDLIEEAIAALQLPIHGIRLMEGKDF